MEVGAIYLIRGGTILRYQGLYSGTGPMLAFRRTAQGMVDPPSGGSVGPEDVLRKLTDADLGWLETRLQQERTRGLYYAASETERVISDLLGVK